MAATKSDTMTEKGRELVITRVFDAPRDLVWKAWTEPERIKQWSAPKGFTIPVADGELRPGGEWKSCMRKPDGTDLWLAGVYQEIDAPHRLVFTHAWLDENGKPGPETLVTVTLTERAGKTEMSFRQSGFDSLESRDGHAGGWNECFDRLEELLAKG